MTNEPLPAPPPGKPLEPPPPGALPRLPLSSRITWKGKLGLGLLIFVGFVICALYWDQVESHQAFFMIVGLIVAGVLWSATRPRKW